MKHKINQYDLSGEYGIGWTFNTNQEFYFDIEDYDKIKNYCWCEEINKGYHRLTARDCSNKVNVLMTTVLGLKYYDHIDRNPLNNKKDNLRPASQMKNRQNSSKRSDNTSGVIGVNWLSKQEQWCVRIQVDRKRIFIGSYINKTDAIIARLEAEKKYFGEFVPQQNLFEQYGINKEVTNGIEN